MVKNNVYYEWFASITVPNPDQVGYWVDLGADSKGRIIKVYNRDIEKWVVLFDVSKDDYVPPFIGSNGNWWVDNRDTGVKATAEAPYIGDNDHWFTYDPINKVYVDTGIEARGLSAYDIAVKLGFEGSEQDWIDSLSKASEDAAIAALDAATKANEAADKANQAVEEIEGIVDDAIAATDKAEEIASNPPKIVDGDWWIYDYDTKQYVNTGIAAIGDAFTYKKEYPSVEAMEADWGTADVKLGEYVLINTNDVEDPDDAKVYLKTQEGWKFIVDLSGMQGIQGWSAYEVAVKHGFVGTEAEWVQSLKQPALDAAAEALEAKAQVEATEQAVKEAEASRVTADKTKVTNINEVVEAATKNITATGISITLDKRNLVTNVVENIELNLPASTTALAGLMLPSDKTKLNGIAAGAEVNVNADWNAESGDAQILNKPTLATVATSGSYNDLTNKPTIPTVDVNKKYVDDKLATKADLADYTVFDIFMKVANGDTPSISQEDYNTLLEKLPNGFVNTLPIRGNSAYISSFFGGYNTNGDNSIWFYAQQTMGVNHCSIQMWIRQNLDVETQVNNDYLIPVTDGISIQASVTDNSTDPNVKEVIIHTTGDGSKALMNDGKYRKLPVYGRNLLLGSGKEVSNSKYEMADYWLTEPISKGTQVTLTIFGELGDDKEMFTIYNSTGAVGSMAQFSKTDFVNGKASKTFKWITNIGDAVADNTHMVVFSSPKTGTSISTIHKIKLEYGDISTEWSPAWEDIPDLEERYAYGVEWDTASSSPDGVRVGNMQLHRELPVQSKMRRCLLDRDGGVKEYLDNELSWGGSYLDYAVMTEMPEHWYKLYFNGTKFRMMLSEIPLPGYKHVDKFYISTYEARMYRTDNLLCSAAGASKLSDPNSINFRGGDNTAEWDDTYRSLLGCPVTNLTRDQFRQAARKRGSGWEMYTYGAHKTLFWLFAVEYATLNSQKSFNVQKDANGFSQGGLGLGPTQMTDWANFNNANPLIPCGYTNEFGNGSGEKAYVVKNASDGTHATLMANRYRGIENPFGHIWKYTDGANIQVTTGDDGLSILWTTDDPSNFSDSSYTGYDKKGNICRTNGYAKKTLLGEDGDIVTTEIGGSSSTYWCDYYATNTSTNRMQVIQVGGNADSETSAGLAYVGAGDPPSGAYRRVGSRLCFFPKYKSTEITTTTE